MAVVTTNLVTQVQARIDGLSGSETLEDLLLLSKATEGLAVNTAPLDAALSALIVSLGGSSSLTELLLAGKAAVRPAKQAFVPIGALAKLANWHNLFAEVDGAGYIRSGHFISSGYSSELNSKAFSPKFFSTVNIGATDGTYYSAASNTGAIVAAGTSGRIRYSANDGSTWGEASVAAAAFYDVTTDGNGVWIAVGNGGSIRRSTNGGANWSSISGASGTLTAIATNGNGVWVAVSSSGAIFRSIDNGLSFSSVTSPLSSFNGVAAGSNGVWFAVGSSGAVAKSTNNGATWVSVSLSVSFVANAVTTDKAGKWAICGSSGTIIISLDDGVSWTKVQSAISVTLVGIKYAFGYWVSISAAQVSYSSDGFNWDISNAGVSSGVASVSSHPDGGWIISGSSGLFVRCKAGIGIEYISNVDYLRVY